MNKSYVIANLNILMDVWHRSGGRWHSGESTVQDSPRFWIASVQRFLPVESVLLNPSYGYFLPAKSVSRRYIKCTWHHEIHRNHLKILTLVFGMCLALSISRPLRWPSNQIATWARSIIWKSASKKWFPGAFICLPFRLWSFCQPPLTWWASRSLRRRSVAWITELNPWWIRLQSRCCHPNRSWELFITENKVSMKRSPRHKLWRGLC